MLTITHTPDDGTTIDGTAKGDGSAPLVKRCGFRWSRHQATWYLPGTRGRSVRQHTIDRVTRELRDAGFEVEHSIDNGTAEERAEALDQARAQRAEALDAKSERLAARSEGEHATVDRIMDMIPSGQPILVGHHSERRHRRDIERMDNAMRRSVEAHRESEAAAEGAEATRREQARTHDPAFIGRRIADRERDIRDYERKLERSKHRTEPEYVEWRERITGLLAEARDELALWKRKLDETGAKVYTREDIQKGDLVLIRHGWAEVVRANPKTASCQVGMPWPLKYPYGEIRDHRRPTDEKENEAA